MPEVGNAPSVEQVNAAIEKAKNMDVLAQGVTELVQEIGKLAMKAAILAESLMGIKTAAEAVAPTAEMSAVQAESTPPTPDASAKQ